jgi:hypothetical protein
VGKTGFPFVDANMKELALTGFMSNRGRQNVASFLTKGMSCQEILSVSNSSATENVSARLVPRI